MIFKFKNGGVAKFQNPSGSMPNNKSNNYNYDASKPTDYDYWKYSASNYLNDWKNEIDSDVNYWNNYFQSLYRDPRKYTTPDPYQVDKNAEYYKGLTPEQQKQLQDVEAVAHFNRQTGADIARPDQIPEAEKYFEDEKAAAEMKDYEKEHPWMAGLYRSAVSGDPIYGNISSPYTNWLRYQGKNNAAREYQKRDDMVGSVAAGSSILLPWMLNGIAADFSGGLLSGLGKFGGGWLSSELFGKIGKRGGRWLDKQFGWNNKLEPALEWAGYIRGWNPGSKIGYGLSKNVLRRQLARNFRNFGKSSIPNWWAGNQMKMDILNDAFNAGYKYYPKSYPQIAISYKKGGILKGQNGMFISPITNQITKRLIELMKEQLRKKPEEQKAVGPAVWAYNKQTLIGKDGGNV